MSDTPTLSKLVAVSSRFARSVSLCVGVMVRSLSVERFVPLYVGRREQIGSLPWNPGWFWQVARRRDPS